jgi:hypothetical protein
MLQVSSVHDEFMILSKTRGVFAEEAALYGRGTMAFCKERCQLWHGRFFESSDKDSLEGRPRNGTRKASDVMSALEQFLSHNDHSVF